MSVDSPSNPPNPAPTQAASEYESIISKASIAILIACPVLALLPPRKLDLYTFSLGAGFVVAANHQVRVHTGNGILLNVYQRRQGKEDEKRRQETWQKWEADNTGVKGLAKKVWMGDQKSDWKKQRMQEERDAVEEGKSFSDVIIDQVKEVWGVPKEEDKDDKEAERKE